MINKELIKAYKKKDLMVRLIKSSYEQELKYRDGIFYGENLKFNAVLDEKSLWRTSIETHIGKIEINELDRNTFIIKAINNDSYEYSSFILDTRKSHNLLALKNHFSQDPILTNFKSKDHEGKTFADLFNFHFQYMRRTLVNDYRKKYQFLWEDTGCYSGIDLYDKLLKF